MRETERAADILKRLRDDHGCFCYNTSDRWTAGIPDSVIIPPGKREIWVEFKGANTILEKIQERTILTMRSKGANVFIVRFLEPRLWSVNAECMIRFSTLKEGVAMLLTTLIELSKIRGEHCAFSTD
jgi:hypothetical protein